MRLNTRHFGEIDVDENKRITFDEGIPGFESLHDFVLMAEPDDDPDSGGVFYWMQSTEDPDTAFILVDMIRYNPEYDPLVSEVQMDGLGDYNENDFRVYNIAVMPDDVKNMTVNLKAPIVINTALKKGRQVICTNDDYTVRHYMFK